MGPDPSNPPPGHAPVMLLYQMTLWSKHGFQWRRSLVDLWYLQTLQLNNARYEYWTVGSGSAGLIRLMLFIALQWKLTAPVGWCFNVLRSLLDVSAICKHVGYKGPSERTEHTFLSCWHRWQDGGRFTWMAADVARWINEKIQRNRSESFVLN